MASKSGLTINSTVRSFSNSVANVLSKIDPNRSVKTANTIKNISSWNNSNLAVCPGEGKIHKLPSLGVSFSF